jgi:uncharacterized protein
MPSDGGALEVRKRIEGVDALRGWALLSIGVIHFMEQFLGAMPPADHITYSQHGLADRLIESLGMVFIRGKGFALFSFLFGLSFALQMDKAEERSPGSDFRPRFAWRLGILGSIGALHGLLYGGDILLIYAVLGFPMLLFYRLGTRWLIVPALLLILGMPRIAYQTAVFLTAQPKVAETKVTQNPDGTETKKLLSPEDASRQAEAARHWETLTHGSFTGVLRANASKTLSNKVEFQLGFMGRGYQTFGLFLLGLWAGRRRLFENVEENLATFRRAFRWSVWPTAIISVVALAGMTWVAFHPQPSDGNFGNPWVWQAVVAISLYDAWNFAMTVCYISGFVLLFRKAQVRHWLGLLAPVGRLALTNYLAQTIFGSFLFMGFGFGLLGTVGSSLTLPIGLAFFALCARASTLWLKHYHYGPVEWLWRSLTLLRIQPFRRAAVPAAEGLSRGMRGQTSR